jgi:hypothetical protein
MPKPKKGTTNRGGRPSTVPDGEPVTIRLDGANLQKLAEVMERARFGTKAQILREAISIGLDQILKSYDR